MSYNVFVCLLGFVISFCCCFYVEQMALSVGLIKYDPGVIWMNNGMKLLEEAMTAVVALKSLYFSPFSLKGC